MVDIRQSVQYAIYLSKIGWTVERKRGINYFLKKIPLIGFILKVQRPKRVDFEMIDQLCKRYHVFQIIIEPLNSSSVSNLQLHGFNLSKSPFLPTKTIQIDLTQPIDQITAKFGKDTRYAIRRGEYLKIEKYSSLKDIKVFRDAWRKSVNFRRYVPSLTNLLNLKKSYPNNYSIFLASHNKNNKIIGGAIFTRSYKDFSYYWYGFTNKEGRSSLSQYSLLYNGILWAKKMGCKIFDFEGIYDKRFPIKSWLGFSHFKKSFGGNEILYPGCYIKYRLPF